LALQQGLRGLGATKGDMSAGRGAPARSPASTGHDPRTFAGLTDLICILETTDNDLQT